MTIPVAVASLIEGHPSGQFGYGFRVFQSRRRWTPKREKASVRVGDVRMHSRGLAALAAVLRDAVSLKDAARKSGVNVNRVRRLYDLMCAQGIVLACPCGRAFLHRGLCVVRFPRLHAPRQPRCARCRVRGHNRRTCAGRP